MADTVADFEALERLMAHHRQDARITALVLSCEDHYRMEGNEVYADNVASKWRLHLSRFWGSMKASEITTSRQREYQQKRLAEGAARATINREMAILSKALHLAYEEEPRKIAATPNILFFPENNARKVFITAEELEKIRATAKKDYWPWTGVRIELAYFLGWRKGELLSLKARNFDAAGKCLRLDESKNGEPREVPLTSKLVELVRPLADAPPEKPLFPISSRGWHDVWNQLVKRAGCPHIHFHDFRRTSARSKRWAGVDTSVIMEIQGWKTEAMFRRYAIVAREDKLAALKKVEKLK